VVASVKKSDRKNGDES